MYRFQNFGRLTFITHI